MTQFSVGSNLFDRNCFALACVAVLAGCALGPDYQRPPVETPAAFRESGPWQQARPADDLPRGAWWKVFGDPQLDALEARLEDGSFSLAFARSQYLQARALANGVQAARWPTATAGVGSSRSQASTATARTGSPGIIKDDLAVVSVGWEADLWGRIGRQVEAGEATADAGAADLATVRLSLQAELARSYFLLRVTDAQRHLLADAVAAYEKSLELTRHRHLGGVATRLDVGQAETLLKTTRAQAIDLDVQRNQLEHAIAVLLGQAPAAFCLPEDSLVARLPTLPPGLPSSLLERRPDVAAAERRAAAANAQIGAAKAAFFPSFTISAAAGSESSNLANWFSAPARLWSVGPALAGVIFDGGLRSARLEQARAASDGAAAGYRQVVLQAFQEVEDALSTLRVLEQEALVQAEAVDAAKQTEELTRNLYRLGTVTYLNVVTAQATALSVERTANDLLARRYAASVALIRALGGGWSHNL